MSARGGKKKGKAKKKAPSWRCNWCQTQTTRSQRTGPDGPKTLWAPRTCVRRAAGRNSLDVRKGGAVAVATAASAVTRSAGDGEAYEGVLRRSAGGRADLNSLNFIKIVDILKIFERI